VVEPADEIAFLHPLPVRALWGVGPATAARLAGLGVVSVGDLAAIPEETLCRLLGSAHGQHLARLATGDDLRVVEADRETKSIGHEETFAADFHDHEDLHPHVLRLADGVSERLREAGMRARTVTVKLRFGDRTTITRAHSLRLATGSARVVRAVAVALLQAVDVAPGIRLLGVSVSGLSSGPTAHQLRFACLDDAEPSSEVGSDGDLAAHLPESVVGSPSASDPAWDEVEAALAAIRSRYGPAAVAPAALLVGGGLSVKRRGDTQWGPDGAPDGASGGAPDDAEREATHVDPGGGGRLPADRREADRRE
jgi:DNA polymerase-4